MRQRASMALDEGEELSEVDKPLRWIGRAFDILAATLRAGNEDLKVAQFSEASSLLSALFGCLGPAFKFAEIDYVAKVQDLKKASKFFDSLQMLLDCDVRRKSVRKSGSHSRNLLRVKQGIEMVKVLFEQILSTEGNSLKEPASIAYALVLASFHNWAIRKAVGAGIHVIPTRAQLFKKLNEDEASAQSQMQRYIDASTLVIQYVDSLFLSRNISTAW